MIFLLFSPWPNCAVVAALKEATNFEILRIRVHHSQTRSYYLKSAIEDLACLIHIWEVAIQMCPRNQLPLHKPL
jgi:hypothetical protein